MAALIAALALGLAGVAVAAPSGVVGSVIEAPNPTALSIAVSRSAFGDGAVADVVVAPAGEPDVLALAASLTGSTPIGAPLLLTGGDDSESVLREAARVTGGPGGAAGADGPTIWVIGRDDPGFADIGYEDVRVFTGDVASMADGLLAVWPGGSKSRVLLVESENAAAAALGAAFGASNGIPAIPLGSPPARLTGNHIDRAIVIGDVPVPSGIAVAEKIDESDPSSLSMLVANRLFAKEIAEGFEDTRPVRTVVADGYGSDASAAFLAAVISTLHQINGGSGPLALIDGRPEAAPSETCESSDTDAEAHCIIAGSGPPAVLVTLTGTGTGTGTATAPRDRTSTGHPTVERLPATGGTPVVPIAPMVLALFGVLGAAGLRRRSRTA